MPRRCYGSRASRILDSFILVVARAPIVLRELWKRSLPRQLQRPADQGLLTRAQIRNNLLKYTTLVCTKDQAPKQRMRSKQGLHETLEAIARHAVTADCLPLLSGPLGDVIASRGAGRLSQSDVGNRLVAVEMECVECLCPADGGVDTRGCLAVNRVLCYTTGDIKSEGQAPRFDSLHVSLYFGC